MNATLDFPGRNPLKTGLSTARMIALLARMASRASSSQSPENGSQHCKDRDGKADYVVYSDGSQSPENGSQHCKVEQPRRRHCGGLPKVAIP